MMDSDKVLALLRVQHSEEQAERDFLRIRELRDAIYKAHRYLETSHNPKDKEVAEMLLNALIGKK